MYIFSINLIKKKNKKNKKTKKQKQKWGETPIFNFTH